MCGQFEQGWCGQDGPSVDSLNRVDVVRMDGPSVDSLNMGDVVLVDYGDSFKTGSQLASRGNPVAYV